MGLYKHWYTVVLHPQMQIILNDFSLCIMIRQYVENLQWEYNLWLYLMMLACFTSGKSSKQFKKFGFRQWPWGSCIAWQWEAKETSMIRGNEGKRRFQWALQISISCAELVSSAFLDTKVLRSYWWESWKYARSMMNTVYYKHKHNKQN